MEARAAAVAHALASVGPESIVAGRPGRDGSNVFSIETAPSFGDRGGRAIGGLVSTRGYYELAEEGEELIFPTAITRFLKREGFPINVSGGQRGGVIDITPLLQEMRELRAEVRHVATTTRAVGDNQAAVVESGNQQADKRAKELETTAALQALQLPVAAA